jgi:4-amino-4-deoxy-L-arabinose transferase-like glycosyltransferase
MNRDADKMIAVLAPEIGKKCAEIREKRKEKTQAEIFVLLCAAAILLPTFFLFFGLSLMILAAPVLFAAAALLILSPIFINQQGGSTYDKT